MRECPGIYFAAEPSGRTAKVAGTGLGVWEVLRDFVRDEALDRVRRAFPQLSAAQLTAALIYNKRYSDEILREVEANAALTADALGPRFPGLVRVLATVTCNIRDFIELAGEFVAGSLEHLGILLVPPAFPADDFVAIADAIEHIARQYPDGLTGAVVCLQRSQR
jgi:uncharacterized protein (DUF433 family)